MLCFVLAGIAGQHDALLLCDGLKHLLVDHCLREMEVGCMMHVRLRPHIVLCLLSVSVCVRVSLSITTCNPPNRTHTHHHTHTHTHIQGYGRKGNHHVSVFDVDVI